MWNHKSRNADGHIGIAANNWKSKILSESLGGSDLFTLVYKSNKNTRLSSLLTCNRS